MEATYFKGDQVRRTPYLVPLPAPAKMAAIKHGLESACRMAPVLCACDPRLDLLSDAIRSPYERDETLCAAFVDGLLSERPTPEAALEAVRLFAAQHGIDSTLLEAALATALEGRAAQ
jgi:hypothetical protein